MYSELSEFDRNPELKPLYSSTIKSIQLLSTLRNAKTYLLNWIMFICKGRSYERVLYFANVGESREFERSLYPPQFEVKILNFCHSYFRGTPKYKKVKALKIILLHPYSTLNNERTAHLFKATHKKYLSRKYGLLSTFLTCILKNY